MVDYCIEVYDTFNRRVAAFDQVPLVETVRSMPDQPDTIRGILPADAATLSHGYRLRVTVGGSWFCDAFVTRVQPQWSDARKLILDRYVTFHEVVEFEAERPALDGNVLVSKGFENRSVSSMVKALINSTVGSIHYLVAHRAYPDGARREYQKFLARKSPANELELHGISQGQWVANNRIDTTGAYAKDGDTISGLVVDGVPWPDLRLIMIDSEETNRNSHAEVRHGEVAAWTDDQYAASGYKWRGDASKAALQALLDTKGIDCIELNPHQDALGAYDDRVDMYGRYIALVYGAGECFNAAQVERGHADVYLWQDGKYHVPEMELKDYYSYAGDQEDSVEDIPETLTQFDVSGGVLELLTALGYAAGHCVWTLDPDLAVHFHRVERADQVVFYDPVRVGVALGSDSSGVRNVIYFEGNPVASSLSKTYRRYASMDEYGDRIAHLDCFSISGEEDADKLLEGLLDDLAYPEPCGFVLFHHGITSLRLGDVVEFRDGPLRRLEHRAAGEWGGLFNGQLVGRIRSITHRFCGKEVATTLRLTSPLRSIAEPASFIARSQEPAASLYQFRLDEASIGLDMGYHLD